MTVAARVEALERQVRELALKVEALERTLPGPDPERAEPMKLPRGGR